MPKKGSGAKPPTEDGSQLKERRSKKKPIDPKTLDSKLTLRAEEAWIYLRVSKTMFYLLQQEGSEYHDPSFPEKRFPSKGGSRGVWMTAELKAWDLARLGQAGAGFATSRSSEPATNLQGSTGSHQGMPGPVSQQKPPRETKTAPLYPPTAAIVGKSREELLRAAPGLAASLENPNAAFLNQVRARPITPNQLHRPESRKRLQTPEITQAGEIGLARSTVPAESSLPIEVEAAAPRGAMGHPVRASQPPTPNVQNPAEDQAELKSKLKEVKLSHIPDAAALLRGKNLRGEQVLIADSDFDLTSPTEDAKRVKLQKRDRDTGAVTDVATVLKGELQRWRGVTGIKIEARKKRVYKKPE